MRKITNTPELKFCKSNSALTVPLKSPRVAKGSMALSSKFVSIKSKITEIMGRKEKVKKDLVKVHQKFKISQKKEKSLDLLSNSIENRIKNLDKRKNLLKLTMPGSLQETNKDLIGQLRGYLKRFRTIMSEERELDEAEQGLYIKEGDFSFETRSSESTQAGSLHKDMVQLEILRSTISKTGEKCEGFSRNTNINKYKKENLLNRKRLIEWERAELEKEIKEFQLEFKSREGIRQKVLKLNEKVEKKILEVRQKEKVLRELMQGNKRIQMESRNLKRKREGKVDRGELDERAKVVEEAEEKVMILRDSVDARMLAVESQKMRVKVLEEQVRKKCDSIRKKNELNDLLKEIEETVMEETGTERKSRVKILVQMALDKEKEVRASEN